MTLPHSPTTPTGSAPPPGDLPDSSGPAAPGTDREEAPRRRRRASHVPRTATVPDVVWDGAARYAVVRAWPRSRDHVLLELVSADGTRVGGQWLADPGRLAELARAAPAPARLVGDVLLQPDGADARLTRLPAVMGEPGTRLVVHRPGRRAVLHVAEADHYVKVVRPSAGEGLARLGSLVHDLLDGRVVVPRLRDDSAPARGVLRWTAVPGRPLHDLAADGAWSPDDARAAWYAAGQALVRLHECLPTGNAAAQSQPSASPAGTDAAAAADELGIGTHTVADELATTAKVLDPAVAHGLLDPGLVAAAGDRVTAALEEPVALPVIGLLHRDFHDKQLLLSEGGRIGLIDVDTLTVGERALDVANALVHLELRQAQGLLSGDLADAAAAGFREGVSAGRSSPATEAMWARVEAYAAAARLRLAGVYAFRPRWRAVARGLLQAAATGGLTLPDSAAGGSVTGPRRPWPTRSTGPARNA